MIDDALSDIPAEAGTQVNKFIYFLGCNHFVILLFKYYLGF